MQKGFVPIIIVLAFLVAIGLGVWRYYLYSQQKYSQPSVSQQANSPVSASSVDDLKSWKTYRDDSLGIEFKYPSEWGQMDDCNRVKRVGVTLGPEFLNDPKSLCGTDIFPTFGLVIAKSSNLGEGYEVINKKKIEIGYKEGEYLRVNNVNAPGPKEFVEVEIPFEGSYLKIYLYKIEYTEKLNRILSTFKFLEAGDEIANWKTYINKKFGYSFKYPKEWKIFENDPFKNTLKRDILLYPISRNPNLGSNYVPDGLSVFIKDELYADDQLLKNGTRGDGEVSGKHQVTTFAGIPANKSYVFSDDGRKVNGIIFNYRKKGWSISWPAEGNDSDTYDKIIASFKFL